MSYDQLERELRALYQSEISYKDVHVKLIKILEKYINDEGVSEMLEHFDI